MTLGEQIRAARETKNLSQEELAEYLGVSRQAVSKWENNAALPQGANRAMLCQALDLELPREEIPPKKRHVLPWLGWALAAVLCIALLVLLFVPEGAPAKEQIYPAETSPQGTEIAEPEVTSILFYSRTKEIVQPEEGTETLSYNAARIDSILLQWTGDAPVQRVRMLLIPTWSSENESWNKSTVTPLAWDLEVPAGTENSLLLAADLLHGTGQQGYLQFELHFADRVLRTDEAAIWVYFDDEYTVLAYIKAFDGTCMSFDEVEWVAATEEKRLNALGIDPDELSNGFYIYNEQKDACQTLRVSEDCACRVLDWDSNYVPTDLDVADLAALLAERVGGGLYRLTIRSGQIVAVEEQYVP